jgi:hypothetical protein
MVEAETLKNPEVFVRNLLGRFGAKGALRHDRKHGSEDPPLQRARTPGSWDRRKASGAKAPELLVEVEGQGGRLCRS